MRRSVGVLACALVLHLNLLAGDFACGSHAADAGEGGVAHGHGEGSHAAAEHRGAHPAAHDAHGRAGGPADEADADRSVPHCRTPSRATCCEALASCQLQLAFGGADEAAPFFASVPSLRAADASPGVALRSPEPPPPRV